jgi:hypothetical protein
MTTTLKLTTLMATQEATRLFAIVEERGSNVSPWISLSSPWSLDGLRFGIIDQTIDAIRVLIFVYLVAFYTAFTLERPCKNGKKTHGMGETSLLPLNKDYHELLSHKEEYLNGDELLVWLVLFALSIKFEGKRFCCHSAFLLCSASTVRTSNNKLLVCHAYFGVTSP